MRFESKSTVAFKKGLYAAENQIGPMEYTFSNFCNSEKALGRLLGRAGRSIGRRGKPSRRSFSRRFRRGSSTPIDGDGDGFYALFPGAPDETPMPSILRGPPVSDAKKDAVRELLDILGQVKTRFGPLKTYDDAYKALKEVYPNLRPFTKADVPDGSAEMTQNKRDLVYGVLAAVEIFPPGFGEQLRNVTLEAEKTVFLNTGSALGGAGWVGGATFGIRGRELMVGFNIESIEKVIPETGTTGWQLSPDFLIATRGGSDKFALVTYDLLYTLESMPEFSGADLEEAKRQAYMLSIALHEMGHVLHFEKIREYTGLNRSPLEILSTMFKRKFGAENVEDAIELSKLMLPEKLTSGRQHLKDIADGTFKGTTEGGKDIYARLQRALLELRKVYGDDSWIDELIPESIDNLSDEDIAELLLSLLFQEELTQMERDANFDGLSSREAAQWLNYLRSVSSYADETVREAVAEGMLATIIGLLPDDENNSIFNWLLQESDD